MDNYDNNKTCYDHVGGILEFKCITCNNIPCCIVCILVGGIHSGHMADKIKENDIEIMKNSIKDNINPTANLLKKKELNMECCKKLEKEFKDLQNSIEKSKDKLINHINDNCNRVMDDFKTTILKLSEHINKLQTILNYNNNSSREEMITHYQLSTIILENIKKEDINQFKIQKFNINKDKIDSLIILLEKLSNFEVGDINDQPLTETKNNKESNNRSEMDPKFMNDFSQMNPNLQNQVENEVAISLKQTS